MGYVPALLSLLSFEPGFHSKYAIAWEPFPGVSVARIELESISDDWSFLSQGPSCMIARAFPYDRPCCFPKFEATETIEATGTNIRKTQSASRAYIRSVAIFRALESMEFDQSKGICFHRSITAQNRLDFHKKSTIILYLRSTYFLFACIFEDIYQFNALSSW